MAHTRLEAFSKIKSYVDERARFIKWIGSTDDQPIKNFKAGDVIYTASDMNPYDSPLYDPDTQTWYLEAGAMFEVLTDFALTDFLAYTDYAYLPSGKVPSGTTYEDSPLQLLTLDCLHLAEATPFDLFSFTFSDARYPSNTIIFNRTGSVVSLNGGGTLDDDTTFEAGMVQMTSGTMGMQVNEEFNPSDGPQYFGGYTHIGKIQFNWNGDATDFGKIVYADLVYSKNQVYMYLPESVTIPSGASVYFGGTYSVHSQWSLDGFKSIMPNFIES